ncbi:hypothetical protein [Nocardia bovistercoris]|uniref:Uncharacterized protein n=1 Tax=Nocardia bovistercoris TaxID=2785916 RepID=A0A931IGF7_9NOCA|nr:hypothetical protein [Nocardia bovistercoris]MBH0779941.1 hypothetical protein [Nocardia bovistercoris]
MPTWMSLVLAALAGIGTIGLLAGVMLMAARSPEDLVDSSAATRAPRDDPASSAADSATTPGSSEADGRASIWPHTWTHEAPDGALGVDEAHREMQVHRNCRLDGCARKATAFQTLIEAGRVVPDSGRMPY